MPTARESLRFDRQTGEWVLNMEFGAGEHSSGSPLDISIDEAHDGENNFIEFDHGTFRNRPAFDLVATAPNAAPINGFVELIKTDGTVTLLVQAGGNVYDWDGESTFNLVGTVPSNARIRGNRFSTFAVDDKVIITDLNKAGPVKTWDGTTFEDLATNIGGEFRAAYCLIDRERAYYGNVQTTSDTPHLLVGSARSAVGTLTVTDRPSSALSVGDPFFIPTPDLRPINGLVNNFGQFVISSSGQGIGSIYKLSGSTAKDFQIDPLYEESGAAGDEAVVHVGNDVLWGRNGRIESLLGVEGFGDVEADDVSRWISGSVSDVKGWTMKYNRRTQKGYFWPDDGNEVWVFNKFLYDTLRSVVRVTRPEVPQGVSPWTRWTTNYGNADFRVTAAEVLKRPGDKSDFTYFGMTDGTIFQMEGEGLQDAGTTDVATYRLSPMIAGLQGDAYDVTALVTYVKKFASTVTLTFEFQGETLFDKAITMDIPGFSNQPVFGGNYYFAGDFYFGTEFEGRLQRQKKRAPGRSGFFQVRTAVTGSEFDIHEIELRFKPAPKT